MSQLVLGRDKILNILKIRLEAAKKFGGVVDFIAGDAGIGKTTLIEAFKERNLDCNMVYVQCSSLTDSDDLYKPCNDALNLLYKIESEQKEEGRFRRMLRKVNAEKILDVGSKVLNIIPGCDLPAAIIDMALSAIQKEDIDEIKQIEKYKSDRVLLYTDLFLGLSIKKPLVVIFDDLHWADRGTTNVIKHIFQMLLERANKNEESAQLMVLCSLREAEAKADSLKNGINEMFTFMNRYNKRESAYLFMKHDIDPLEDGIMLELIKYNLDNTENISKDLKLWLLKKCAGNPLMLENYIDVLKEYKIIEQEENIWRDFEEVKFIEDQPVLRGRLLNADKKGVFGKNGAVILASLRNLSDVELKILYVASIFTNYFTLEAVGDILGLTEEEIYWSVNHLEQMNFVNTLDSYYNGVEDVVTYEITSKMLKETLYSDLSARQSKIYEVKLAQYYEKQVERLETMKEIIERIDESHLVAKDSIYLKNASIYKELEKYHKLAYFHYDRSGLAVKAIQHCLPSLERLLESHEIAVGNKESISYEDSYRALEHGFQSVDTLFDRIIDELFFKDFEDKEYILSLRIKIVSMYAKFYTLNGLYNKAIQEIKNSYNIGILTNDSNDDMQILLQLMELLYKSGNHTQARVILEKILSYIEENINGLAQEELEEVVEVIFDYFVFDYIARIKFAEKFINIAEENLTKNLDYIYSKYVNVLIKFHEIGLANEFISKIQALNKKQSYYSSSLNSLYVGLFDTIEDIISLDYTEVMESVAEGTFDGKIDNFIVANQFYWKWRIDAARLILQTYLHEYHNRFEDIDYMSRSQLIFGVLRLLNWLDISSRLSQYPNEEENIGECDIEDDDIDEESLNSLKLFESAAEKLYKEFILIIPMNEFLRYYLFELREKMDIDAWWEGLDICSHFFENSIYLKDLIGIYSQLIDSDFMLSDFESRLELISSWGIAVADNEELISKFVDKILNDVLPSLDDSYQRYKIIGNILSWEWLSGKFQVLPYITEYIDFEIEHKTFEDAGFALEANEDLLDKKDFKTLKERLELAQDLKYLQDDNEQPRDTTFDDYSSENDFVKYRLANIIETEALLYTVREEMDDIESEMYCLREYLKIKSLLVGNSIASIALQECYKSIAEFCAMLANEEDIEYDIDIEDLESLFGESFDDLDNRDVLISKSVSYYLGAIKSAQIISDYNVVYNYFEAFIEQFIVLSESYGYEKCEGYLKSHYISFEALIDEYYSILEKNGNMEKLVTYLFELNYKYGDLEINRKIMIPKLNEVIDNLKKSIAHSQIDLYFNKYVE